MASIPASVSGMRSSASVAPFRAIDRRSVPALGLRAVGRGLPDPVAGGACSGLNLPPYVTGPASCGAFFSRRAVRRRGAAEDGVGSAIARKLDGIRRRWVLAFWGGERRCLEYPGSWAVPPSDRSKQLGKPNV